MEVGDLVRRTAISPYSPHVVGIVIKTCTFPEDEKCEVLWPSGSITAPLKKNLKVINGSR